MQVATIQPSQPMITDEMLLAMPISPEDLRGLKSPRVLRLAKLRTGRRFDRRAEAEAALLAMEDAA